ncbi:MAG: glycoside hydrolase family 28 protein, partial [Bacteroidaceae bacterium]|nr:glycoside hydrolase family 28 protein [Bacteroidaceae bacterium]
MNKINYTVFLALFSLHLTSGLAATYNVKDFGAMGNGKHIDSPAINEAIDKAAEDGGGTVLISEGQYLCYSIRLKSGITLRLEKGAVIKAAQVSSEAGYD